MRTQFTNLWAYALVLSTATLPLTLASKTLGNNKSQGIPYEIRGFCELPNTSLFSIRNLETGGSRWVEIGQQHGTITVMDYNRGTGLFRAVYQESEVFLKLQTPDIWAKPVNAAFAGTEEILTQQKVDSLIDAYSRELTETLPRESHKLHGAMKIAANNRLNAYKTELQGALERQQSSSVKIDTENKGPDPKPSIRNLRETNKVNARIWASDHIREHGEPDERLTRMP